MLSFVSIIAMLLLVNGDHGEHPSTEEVMNCFQSIAASFDLNVDEAISKEFAERIADKLPKSFNSLCNDVPLIASMASMLNDNDNDNGNDIENDIVRRIRRRRRLQNEEVCLNNGEMFCKPVEPEFSTGASYDTLLRALSDPNMILREADPTGLLDELITPLLDEFSREIYTNADAVSRLLQDLLIADSALAVAGAACDELINCAIDPTGAAACLASGLCLITVRAAQILADTVRVLLDEADTHDHVLMSTHITALFEDRSRIINNQQFLVNQIDDRFAELTDLINDRFDFLEELNIRLFDLQNNFLNTRFNDIFFQLNTIDMLIRTPNGQRPGWNEQTGLDDLFVEPTNISVPRATDNIMIPEPEPEPETINAAGHSININPIKSFVAGDNDKKVIASDYNINLLIVANLTLLLLLLIAIIINTLLLCRTQNHKYSRIQQKN